LKDPARHQHQSESNTDKTLWLQVKRETMVADEDPRQEDTENVRFSEIPTNDDVKLMLSTVELTLGNLDKIVEQIAFWLLKKGDPLRSRDAYAGFCVRLAETYTVLDDSGLQVRID
jgi:hypothetical protein